MIRRPVDKEDVRPTANYIVWSAGEDTDNQGWAAALCDHLATFHGGRLNELHFCLEQWAPSKWGMILTGSVLVSDIVLPPRNEEKNVASFPALANAIYGQTENGWLSSTSTMLVDSRLTFWVSEGVTGVVSRAVHAFMFRTPRRMRLRDIEKAIAEFVRGAQLAEEAGFVELHATHGYLIAQFLSPKSNKRTGCLGRDDMLWFLFRIVHDIRLPTFILGIKLNSTDSASTRSSTSKALHRGMCRLHRGQALFVDFSTRARDSLAPLPPDKRPLVLFTGDLSNPAQLRNALAAGHTDLVVLGRICGPMSRRAVSFTQRPSLPRTARPRLPSPPRALVPRAKQAHRGSGTKMAWYTVMLRLLAQHREVDPEMGPVVGLVWIWF
uniref:FMN-linked oxidoreductase n=1 Tax=Mycena chlorophos TaxID=658473 RepID=A0ABQ0L823_MYCCL|nr:FMN-linked oxidoreductase [Mycena chlorophos]